MKVLVTGGAGYIGSVLTAFLIDKGVNVNIIDNLSTGKSELIDKRSTFFKGDVLNTEELTDAMIGCDAVVHLAAKTLVGESVLEPENYNKVNYLGTKNVLKTMVDLRIMKLIFSSTCAVYGDINSESISENTPTNPINPYGTSKLLSDEEIKKQSNQSNLDTYSFRFFNVAGSYTNLCGQMFGEAHDNETHLIPKILISNNVTIFGTDWETRDGTCVRDYVHVTDLANAVYLALMANSKPGHKIYNLSSGKGHSVIEIINAINFVLQKEIKIIKDDRRIGDSMVLVGNSDLVFKELGWESTKSIEEIIRDTFNFLRNNPISKPEI